MAELDNGKKDVGSGSFSEASHPTTTPTADHPLDDVAPSVVLSSSEPSPQVLTPRPHLFSSLEEAHSQITSRSREGSRQVSGATRSSESGDESFLMSLSPTDDARALYTNASFPIPHAFGRSLTDSVTPQLPRSRGVQQLNNINLNLAQAVTSQPSSRTEPVVRRSTTRRYIEARDFAEADISNQPPPYTPGNTAGHIVRQHGASAQALPAVQPQTGICGCSEDSDFSFGDYDDRVESNAGTGHVAEDEPYLLPPFNTPVTTGGGARNVQAPLRSATEPSSDREVRGRNIVGYDRTGVAGNQTAPDMPLPEDPPFHPSNPFAARINHSGIAKAALKVDASLSSDSSGSPRPLLHWSDSEDDCARIGSDLGVKSEAEAEAEAENRLSILMPPPERMHSARRREYGRRSEHGRRSFPSTALKSASGTTAGGSDNDDPFKYDRLFPQPSKEREVSLCLHQVSGIGEDGSPIAFSPDRTPLRSTGQSFDGGAVSPAEQRLLSSTRSANMTPAQFSGPNAKEQPHGFIQHGHGFFDSSAINPEWALGSPDAVRVPVRQGSLPDQEQSLEGPHQDDQGATQQLVLEGLRRGGHGSMVGAGLTYNTEFGTSGFKRCGSSIANYSDCDIPSEAASTRPNLQPPPGEAQEDHQQQGIGLFATRPRLVHPPGSNANPQDTRYRRHNINQAPVPVFVPKQRTHRVNGLFQNSSRPIPEVESEAESVGQQGQKRSPSLSQMISGAIRQPFRRSSSKRPPVQISTLHDGQTPRHPFVELGSEDGHESHEHGIELTNIAAQPNLRDQIHRPPTRHAPIPPAAVLPPPLRMPQAHFDNRNRGDSLESTASASLMDSGRFELIPLDVAQRRQAQRRASGQEDQTLTGRERLHSMRNASYTTDASQAGSQPATPSSAMTPNTGKVKRFVPRAFAQFSSPPSGRNEDDTNGALIVDDDTRPTISTVTGSDVTITTIHNPDGSQYRIFDPAPRLYPWDQRHRRPATQKSTDQSLQRMAHRALDNPDSMERGTVSRRARDNEHWLSDEARARRRGFFMITALLGIFPFFSLLAIAGTLDSALSWHTRGEVNRFSLRQKRFLLAEFIVMLMATMAIFIFIAIKFSLHH